MIFYIIILTIGELLAQFLLRMGITNKHMIPLGMFVYSIVGYVYYLGLIENKFASLSILWHVVMAIASILIGIFYFKEKYNKKELFGLFLGIISILLLHNHHH